MQYNTPKHNNEVIFSCCQMKHKTKMKRMEKATIHITGKKVVKVFGAACLATGVVALSAVVASGAAGEAVVAEGTADEVPTENTNITDAAEEL